MSDDSVSRFVVMQGAVLNTWMVWDRKFQGPERIPGGMAINQSKEEARKLRDKLTLDEDRG